MSEQADRSKAYGTDEAYGDDLIGYREGRLTAEQFQNYWGHPPDPGADERRTRADQEAAELLEAQHRRLIGIGVPRLHATKIHADEMYETEALRYAREFLESGQTFLVLIGEADRGKTQAACWWLREYCRAHWGWWRAAAACYFENRPSSDPAFTTARAIQRRQFEKSAVNDLLDAQALVLDDLGVEAREKGEWFTALVDEIFDVRYGQRRPTVVTTNLTWDELRRRYGRRVEGRLTESGRVVGCGGPSLRGCR